MGVAHDSQCLDKMVESIRGSLELNYAAKLAVNGQRMDAPCEAQFVTGSGAGMRTAIDGSRATDLYNERCTSGRCWQSRGLQ